MGKNKNGLKKYDNVGYFFVLPFVIVFCIFSVYPVLRTLYSVLQMPRLQESV